MNNYESERTARREEFRPPLRGCVAKDLRMAGAIEHCYVDTFASIAADVYYSLILAPVNRSLSELFDDLATEELDQFRILGELMLALGGDAALRTVPRGRWNRTQRRGSDGVGAAQVSLCVAQKEQNIDRYETLMAHTGDRVVRSVLAGLLGRERRMYERLCVFLQG